MKSEQKNEIKRCVPSVGVVLDPTFFLYFNARNFQTKHLQSLIKWVNNNPEKIRAKSHTRRLKGWDASFTRLRERWGASCSRPENFQGDNFFLKSPGRLRRLLGQPLNPVSTQPWGWGYPPTWAGRKPPKRERPPSPKSPILINTWEESNWRPQFLKCFSI